MDFPKTFCIIFLKVPIGISLIYWITQCWEYSFGQIDEWKENVRDIIMDRMKSNEIIKKYFAEEQGVVYKPIDFYNSDVDFFRDMPNDSYDDVFFCDKETVLKSHNEIDIELFMAVNKFDFKKVEELLSQGANPNEEFHEMDGYDCFGRIGAERSFLSLELTLAWIDQQMPADENSLQDLFGFAAHELMYEMLSHSNRLDLHSIKKQ